MGTHFFHTYLASRKDGPPKGHVTALVLLVMLAACAPSAPPTLSVEAPVTKDIERTQISDESAPKDAELPEVDLPQFDLPGSELTEAAPATDAALQERTQAQADNQTQPRAQDVRTAALIAEIDKALNDVADGDGIRQPTDEIGDIIWELEQSDNVSVSQDPVPSFADLVPEGRDPSLEKEALEAAFAMLRTPQTSQATALFEFPEKAASKRRIGVFVPLSGPRAIYGAQVSHGVEMAYFQLRDPLIELIYFDSADEAGLPAVAATATQAQIDIAIGPLFSDNAKEIYPFLAASNVPILSLSNNQRIARSGLWVTGLLPEQQIDALLAKTLLSGHDQLAILSDQSAYGSQMTQHIITRLTDFGATPAKVMVVDGTVGADDEGLVAQLKDFADYRPLEDDELVQDKPAPYDGVILAGGADFVLKVAPLLSYYDLGPDRVHYLGTDLWASAGLLGEPSLQGAFVSTISPDLRTAFNKRYQAIYTTKGQAQQSSFLSQLGFDVMAVAASATKDTSKTQTQSLQNPLISRLVRETGYKGFTGTFRLLANGQNQRSYAVFQVEDGALATAEIAPKDATALTQ